MRKRELKEAAYPEPVKAFYKRMANRISKLYYKRRSRIETVNGILHNRLHDGFQLRGKANIKAELLLQVISHNIMQSFKLKVAA